MMDSSVSSSPRRRKSRKSWNDNSPVANADIAREETLLLTHFTKKPTISFGKVKVGKTIHRKLLVTNPHEFDQFVHVEKFPHDEHFEMELMDFEVPAESTLSLNISWTPEREGGCRQMILFFIDESYRLQAVLYGTAVVPRQKKVAVRGIMSCVKTPFSVLHTPNLTNIKSYNSTEIQYKTVSSKRTQSKTISNRENTVPVSTKMVTKKRISPNQCTVKNYSCKKNDSVSCKNVTTNLELKTECSVQEISSISKNVSCVPYEDSPENKTIEIDNAVEVLTCVRNVTVESAENANEYQHSYVTTKRQKQMADEVTGPSFCKQSPRRETYLVKKQKRRSWKNKLKKSPTSSGSLPVVTSFSPPQLSPPYHVYDNSVKNTTLSINSVSPIQTNFLLTSSPIESHHQTSACPNRSNLLLPGSDFQDVHQREDKEDNTKLEMLSQLGHPSESNLIEKQASPKSDNGLSSDSLNSRYSSPNSEIIYDLHQTPMISVEDTSISRRSTHVIKEPKIICKAGVLKKKSLFCWEKMPTSVQKVPVNCKVIRANATPRNDRVSLSSKVRTAKRVTQSTEKAPCEKEKTQMKRRSVLSPKKPAVAQSRLILGKREKTVIPKHPMPFASKNIYYDERWMQKQEWSFTHWFNYILTPVEEYKIRKCVKVDAKSLLFSTKQEARLAPSKEVLSFEAYAARKRLNRLRKLACKMFQTEDIVKVVRRLEVEIDSQRLVMRKDRPVHADIGLKQMILNWILSYNSLWLRIGLEMVFGEILLIDSNTDFLGISRFIVTRLLGNPDIANRYAHPTVPHLYREGYQDALSKHTLKKYLILVFFLDYAKRKRLIEHDPCLFCKDAEIKASKDLLYNIARIFLKGEGDVARHLSYFGYTVSYVQTPLHEFDYAVSNLAVDLRDGIRLTRVIEILTGKWELTDSLRAPAISRLQKIHNVNKVLKALLNNGMDLSLAKGSICAKDIVDGHREKTLTLLWRIVTGFQVDILLDINELRDEVHFLKRCLEKKRSVRKLAGVEDYSIKRNSVEGLLKPENEKHQLLFEWCQAVSAHYGLQIENFTVSFSDGRVLCYLIHHYYPGLLPLSEIKRDTTVTYINECENQQQDSDQSLDELTFSTRFSPKTGKPKIYEALLANEAENFKLIAKKVSAIGGVPAMLRHSDMSNTIPDEKVVITYITYLAIRLLEIRHEARAAIVIQMAWRKYLWRKKQRLQRMKSKSAVVTQWQCNTINKIQVLSPQVGSYNKTSSLVEHSNKNLALSPFQCDQKHNNTEHSYLPKCNLDTIAEVSCLDLVSDGNNYQRDAETNNSPLNLVIRKVNDSNDLGQQKQENRNAREGCISLKTSKLNQTIEFEHEDFNNPLNGTFEINNNNKPHHSRLLNQTIDIDNGVQSNICSVEKSGDEIVTEYIGVQAISKQQSVCSPNKYLEHNQNLNDGTPDRNIDLNDKANINESEANSTTEIRSRLETSTLNELEHLSTLDDSGKFLKRAKINKVHCDLKKDTTNEHCDQPDAYAENCGQLDDPTDGHCDLQNNLDCYHEHNLQNDSTDSHRGLLDDSTNSHRDLLDDSTDGHHDLQNDSTDCNRVLQNDSTDGDHVLLQTASTDSDHVLLQNDYTDGNHVLLQNDSADGNRVLLQNDSAFGDHVLRNDSAVGDHVLQNDSTDGDRVLLQNDSTDGNRVLLQNDSAFGDHVLRNDSAVGDHVLRNDSAVGDHVLRNDSTDGNHVLLQNDSAVGDHVLRNDSAVGDHVLRNDSAVGDHVLQNDSAVGDHVLRNDSAVGDHVLRNDSAVGDHVLRNDSAVGDHVLRNDSAVGDHVLRNDSAVGDHVLRNDSAVGDHVLRNDSAVGDHVLRNDSAVGDHVLQNDSTDGDHVLRNDSAVGDHVLRNDSTDGDRVLLQNDSADGDCVRLQNDSTVGDRVLQNDSTDGDRVLLQNDSADGNRVLLQNDSADGNRVLLQCDSADGNCVPLQNDSADGDHVPLQNDCADGDRVLLLNDSTDGDRGLQNGSTDGHHDLSADCPADGHCDLQDEFSHCDQDFSMVSNGDDQKGSSASSTANIITDANNSRIVDYERLSSSKYDSKHLSQVECDESDSADGTQVLNSSKINTSLQPHSDMDFEEKSLILQNQINAGDSRPNILDVSRGVLEQQCAIVIQRWYRNHQESYRVASDYQRMKSAVIVLQSFYRMYSQQRKYHKQLEAIRVLQAAVRMHQKRQNYRSLCKSTTQIQRWYRGIILCRKQRNKFLKEKQASIQIQSMWRGAMQRQLLKSQVAAAVVIQSSFRKHYCQSRYLKLLSSVILIQKLYRSKLESRKLRMQFLQELREKQLQEEKRQNNAAQLIQATWKCYVAQKEFSKLKTATCVLQQYMSAYLIGKRVRHDFIAQKNAAIKIQSNLRGFIARRRYNNIIASVTLIQALFRGSQVRRELQLKCHSAVIIQCRWRAYLAKTKFQAEKRTIIRMQALVRAKQQQKKYLNCKNAAIVIQQWYRSISQMRQCHKDYLELKKYTKILQARFRALRSMKICRQQFLQKRIAVTTIQAHVRQFLTRQKFCKQKESVVLLQNWFRACKVAKSDRAYYLSLKTYTIKMQSHVRSWQQQKKFLELKDSALKIQNWYRAVILMRSDQQRYIEYRTAVIKIQSVYRCYREQKKFNKRKQCAVKLQEWWRATSSMRAERKSYLSKQVAIRVIQQWFQSLIAMKLAREDYLKVRASVITIQSHLRRTIQERHFKRTKSSVIKIQQWYRACIQMEIERKNYCSLKTSTVFLQSIVRMKLERRCFLTQRSSAIKIQRWYRILESRRQLKETIARRHAAATFIQNWFKRAIAVKVPAEYWLLKTRTKKLNAVCTVQKYCRRWLHRRHQAATVIQSCIRGWLVRKCLAKQTAAAIVIQTNIRAFYARRLFERKKSAILTIERYLQQYLKRRDHAAQLIQRIMRGWIVRKRVKKLHHNATLIQSCWRGYKVRCQSKQTITKLRQRLLAVTKEATEDKKLISRFAEGFDQLMKFKQLSDVLHALVNLEAASRLSPVCCLQLARENAIPVIYNIVKGCNRSVPHMELIKYSIQIFLNLAKYAPTIESVYHSRPDAIDILLNVMMVFREKGLVFSKSCILLGSIALDLKEKGRMDELLSRQQFVEKILSLYKLTVRKYKQEETRIVTRARLVAAKDACPFYENTVLSKIGECEPKSAFTVNECEHKSAFTMND
ncbi:spindle-like microcephaly-associated homolog [Octopus vulgaris]|uniref:Spindle-like microcephaly-associated homolog n=1 Tax=Octopus vulgaris TaxID=6645 RepID=A0AA36AJ54_OCTVU|nr:spindle-like microcephaly-associated homolog [Octopus vulgaris]